MCIFHEEVDLKKITGIIGARRRNNREGLQELQDRITGSKISIMDAALGRNGEREGGREEGGEGGREGGRKGEREGGRGVKNRYIQ